MIEIHRREVAVRLDGHTMLVQTPYGGYEVELSRAELMDILGEAVKTTIPKVDLCGAGENACSPGCCS